MPNLSLMSLFSTGAHRGNHKSRMNPKLKGFIYGTDNQSLCVIDLVKTLDSLDRACQLMFRLGQKRKQAFVVGSSKYIKDFTLDLANQFLPQESMPYVNSRWLGGTLTNWTTVRKTLKTLDKLESFENNTEFFEKLSRNEQLSISRDKAKKMLLFSGLRNLKTNKPGVVIILDTQRSKTAIQEAEEVGVPIIALTNLNCPILPKNLNTTIVCNNFSVETVKLITAELVAAYQQGLQDGAAVTETQPQQVHTNQSVRIQA